MKLVITTSVIGCFPKEQQEKIKAVRDIPTGIVTPLEGKIVLDFHDECDGKAYINFATGIYFKSSRSNISLNLF